jgi:hypothetical protein
MLAARKSYELKYVIFVPAVAMLVATLVVVGMNFYFASAHMNDSVSEQLFYDLEYDTYTDMTYQQYVSLEIQNLYPEMSMLLFSNFGAVIIGAMIFRKLRCIFGGPKAVNSKL